MKVLRASCRVLFKHFNLTELLLLVQRLKVSSLILRKCITCFYQKTILSMKTNYIKKKFGVIQLVLVKCPRVLVLRRHKTPAAYCYNHPYPVFLCLSVLELAFYRKWYFFDLTCYYGFRAEEREFNILYCRLSASRFALWEDFPVCCLYLKWWSLLRTESRLTYDTRGRHVPGQTELTKLEWMLLLKYLLYPCH